jgi:microcystin-dependent protein
LVSDLTVTVPNLSKLWWFQNSTTGAFNLYVKTAAGTATQIPQGLGLMVMGDGNNNLVRHDKPGIGSFQISGKATAGPGELACNGASLLRASYPDLFTAIGTTFGAADGTHFTLPLLTDTNRYLRAAGGALAVGAYQASQNKAHTHTGSGTTSVESATHTHAGSGNTGAMSANASHSHTSNAAFAGGGTATVGSSLGANSGATIDATNTDHVHAYSFTTSGQSANHTHTYSFTTSGGSADGTEARPESMAALICIRY